MADNEVTQDNSQESLSDASGQAAPEVLTDTLPVSADEAAGAAAEPESPEGDSEDVASGETIPVPDGLSPQESLQLMGRSLVEAYNTKVLELKKQVELAAESLTLLEDAELVRLDPTICPRNTVFEHRRHRYRWTDTESGEEQESLETEHCQSGLCNLGQGAEDSLWLKKTTLWNRYTDARQRLAELAEQREEQERQAAEILQQAQDVGDDTNTEVESVELVNPADLSLPAVAEPMSAVAPDERTDEERRQQKNQLLSAIEAGTFDAELRRSDGTLDDFGTVLPDEYRNDADVWFVILQRFPEQAENLPQEALSDPQFALKMMETRGVAAERALAEIPTEITESTDFILKLMETNWRAARDACPLEAKNNPEVALKALRHFEQDALDTFEWLGEGAKDSALVMNAAVLMSPATIRHVSRRLRNDRDFLHDVLTASLALCDQATRRELSKADVSNAPSFDWRVAYREQSRFRIDRRVDFWPAIETILERTKDDPRDDDQVMLLAVLHDGRAMQYASDRLKSDRMFVITALDTIHEKLPPRHAAEACRAVCEHLGELLRDDEELTMFAVACVGGQDIMNCWSERLRRDRNFILQAMKSALYRGRMLESLPDFLRDDEAVVELALQTDGTALQFASDRLQQDRRFVLRAIKASATNETFEAVTSVSRRFFGDYDPPGDGGDILWFAANRPLISPADVHESLHNDPDVVLGCLESGASVRGATPQLLGDFKFVRRAIESFGRRAAHPQLPLKIGDRLINLLPERMRDSDELMLAAIERQGNSAKYATARLRNNPAFSARAVQVSENARATLDHLARSMRDDDSVMQSTARRNAELAVSLASDRIKSDRQFAFTAMRASNDPESLRSQLIEALPDSSEVPPDAVEIPKREGITIADLWTLLVVILGGLLFGYTAYVLPTIETQFMDGTTLIRAAVGILLGIGFIGALNRVVASRRGNAVPVGPPPATEEKEARLLLPPEDPERGVHYTRGGGVEPFRPNRDGGRG